MTNSTTTKIEPGPLRSSQRFHRFGNQSFRRLAKRSADIGLTFVDDQFKQNDRQIYQTSAFRSRFNISKAVWKRPKQLLQENDFNFEPTLMPMIKTEHNHLFVGHSPNPWLVAAALSISQHRSLFDQLINVDEQNFRDHGIVRFTIWQLGVWHKIVIDDRLPSIDSEPIFTRPIWSNSSWWLPLLEKAYAKLFGSYESMITNGSLHSALIDFTGGGSVETIDLSSYHSDSGHSGHHHSNSNSDHSLWSLISHEFQSKSLLILKTKEFKPIGSAPFGLVSNRYYLIRNIKKPMGTLKRLLSSKSSTTTTKSSSDHQQDNLPLLITNTIADGVKNSKSTTTLSLNSKKGLQEFWILLNNVPNLFDTLTICRPYQYQKDSIHQLIVNKSFKVGVGGDSSSLQFRFDVHRPMSSSSATNHHHHHSSTVVESDDQDSNHQPNHDEHLHINFNLIQKNSPIIPIGFRLYSIEMNRKFKVHQFSSLPLIKQIDPIQSRNLITKISIPLINGRYLLVPICPEISTLLISIYSEYVTEFRQLTMDMPRYNHNHLPSLLTSWMQPIYPNAMTRVQVFGVEGLERQDRFGSANPYCIIRCGRKFVKSSIRYETLMPTWENFSAIFYHRNIDKMKPICIEIWHRGILVDYFLGSVKFRPKLTTMIIDDDGGGADVQNSNEQFVDPEQQEEEQQQQEEQPIDDPPNDEATMSKSDDNDAVDLNYQMNIETISNDDDNDHDHDHDADLSIEKQQQQPNHNRLQNENVLTAAPADDNHHDQDFICLQLMDKKGHLKRPGFVLIRSKTIEDLKYF